MQNLITLMLQWDGKTAYGYITMLYLCIDLKVLEVICKMIRFKLSNNFIIDIIFSLLGSMGERRTIIRWHLAHFINVKQSFPSIYTKVLY
jgi:hypothetical protein